MAEQRLDTSQVGAVIEQMGRKAVAQFVWADIDGQTAGFVIFFEQIRNGPRRHAAAEFADEQRSIHHPGGIAIVMNRFGGFSSDRANPFFAAFSEHANAFVEKIEIAHVQRRQLGETDSAAVKKLENRGITLGKPVRCLLRMLHRQRQQKQFLDLFLRQNDGQFFLCFRQLDIGEGIYEQIFPADEEFEKTPQCREMKPNGGPRPIAFHAGEEVITEIVGLARFPARKIATIDAVTHQRVVVIAQRARGRIFLDRQVFEKFIDEGILDRLFF